MRTTIAASKVECVVEAGDVLGETPLWCDRSKKLWWVDIERQLHQSFDPLTGGHEIFHHECRFLGSHALTSSGSHLLTKDLEIYRHDIADGATEILARVEQGHENRINDGRVDARGRLWIGTLDNELRRPNGSLYCVEPSSFVRPLFGGVIVTNGITFSPDNRKLYFTDTRRYRTWQFDFDLDDGVINNRRLFADYADTKAE